ncbi:hypothetical protein AND_005557 [Anopheles darlingi]|uniref:Secreted protein n=1 Tax=Anopheles darlingi TaxID=43151 RepID=W5JEH9_ANODA|nr:hypothetical protein AND_005557 [Anopheles darlingi]
MRALVKLVIRLIAYRAVSDCQHRVVQSSSSIGCGRGCTPTSVIFTQEPDLAQLHIQHDCHAVHQHPVGHELIPIITMAPNGPSPSGLPAEMIDRTITISDGSMTAAGVGGGVGTVTVDQSMRHLSDQNTQHGHPVVATGLSPMMTSNLNTGVYTLPEESEHDSEECPAM